MCALRLVSCVGLLTCASYTRILHATHNAPRTRIMRVMQSVSKRKRGAVAVSSTWLLRNLAEMLNRTQYGGERFVILRKGKPIAALVNTEDLALLEHVEAA